MTNRLVWKFVGAFILLILGSVLILNFFVGLKLRDFYEKQLSYKLGSNAALIGDILSEEITGGDRTSIQAKVKTLSSQSNSRITILDVKGNVLGDSEKSPEEMDNHGDRLEVIRALEGGVGESNRYSDTLGYNMKYVAVLAKNGDSTSGIVRLALPLQEVEAQIHIIYRTVLIGGSVAIVFVLIIGFFVSKGIIAPIEEMKNAAQAMTEGDFSKRISVHSRDELGVLAVSFNKMADELEQKIDNLRRLDKMRTDFVANVSHELKTPLTSIKGFIETLEDGALDDAENARRFLSIIKKHADALSNITDDLLNLSELESGKDRLTREDFDLKELLEEVVSGFGHALREKGHALEYDFAGSQFRVHADKLKIEQVMVNLIDNAIKYTEPGGRIGLRLHAKQDSIVFAVEDNGIGIPEEHLARLFERFYRVDRGRSRELGGTGLGLAIAKHTVLLHGGDAHVESWEGKGTKMVVTLPKS